MFVPASLLALPGVHAGRVAVPAGAAPLRRCTGVPRRARHAHARTTLSGERQPDAPGHAPASAADAAATARSGNGAAVAAASVGGKDAFRAGSDDVASVGARHAAEQVVAQRDAERERAAAYANGAAESAASAPDDSDEARRALDGPPLVYDKAAMQTYWRQRSGELARRWAQFFGLAAPFVAKLVRKFSTGSMDEAAVAELAADARRAFEKLGPTYIKLAQMLSVRPDVLPLAAMDELARLQDSVASFDTGTAREVIEEALGRRVDDVFSEFGDEPVAAASLAQVYRARLRDSGEEVAVKVQRPEALATVSKDLYVLQRAVQAYQSVIKRWTAQETDYVALLDTWANGFYTELDFFNEAQNQELFRSQVLQSMGGRVYVPLVYMQHCSRRLLITEWVDGIKLTQTPTADIARLVPIGQECFLRQLLEEPGLFHLDSHPGNLLQLIAAPPHASGLPHTPELCLIDFGLTMKIPRRDREVIVNGIVHLANKDWRAVTEDMVELGFLPRSVDRSRIMPLLERVLTPYVFEGGGVAGFTGGSGGGVFSPSFQNLARDLASAAVEIPFSVPPYFALLARAIALLEGIALQADPKYKIVLQSYPYVARRLLRDGGDTDSFRQALNAILYPGDGVAAIGGNGSGAGAGAGDGASARHLSPQRLRVLLNYALDRVAAGSAAGVIDLDALPEEENAATYAELLDLLLSDNARALRGILIEQLAAVADLLLRREVRRVAAQLTRTPPSPVDVLRRLSPLPLPRLPLPLLPPPPPTPLAVLPGRWRESALARIAPPLSESESIYANDVLALLGQLLGLDASVNETDVARLLSATWRKRDDEVTRVMAELAAETLGVDSRARLWRSASVSSIASDPQRAAALREIGVGVRERLREIQSERLRRRRQ